MSWYKERVGEKGAEQEAARGRYRQGKNQEK